MLMSGRLKISQGACSGPNGFPGFAQNTNCLAFVALQTLQICADFLRQIATLLEIPWIFLEFGQCMDLKPFKGDLPKR